MKMETLDPSALQAASSAVIFDPKSQTVTLPGGLVSVAGITVVTGGAELSCSSCMLAFGFWGSLVGLSCASVGLWDQINHLQTGASHLLALGLVILALSFLVVGSVVTFYLLTRKKKLISRREREDGKEVLVEDSQRMIKKMTV